MFQVKICGITTPEDARTVADAGADAIGLNFFARSERFVRDDVASAIAQAVPSSVTKVGLFVNAPAARIRELFDGLKLDLIQLHGDEPPEFLVELGGRPVMRAFRVGADLSPVRDYLTHCRALHVTPRAVLIDAFQADRYGGTGRTADWTAVAKSRDVWGDLPLVLAGGLKAENVAVAIECVRPVAVDTASGVESAPGRKSPKLVVAFVAAARTALARIAHT